MDTVKFDAARARKPGPKGASVITGGRHLIIFIAPALLIYTAFSVIPILDTVRLSFYERTENSLYWVGIQNYHSLFAAGRVWDEFSNALYNNIVFFFLHLLIEIPVAIGLAAMLSTTGLRFKAIYRSLIFMPTVLSVVIIGFIWQLILSPLWGVSAGLLDLIGLPHLFAPWLGNETTALTTVTLISIWQWMGMPVMLLYAALIGLPDDLTDAARVDGANRFQAFLWIRLPLIMPTIALVCILTFVGNFNAFDLIFAMKGAMAGPNYATDLLGTFFYRTFFGFQMQRGDPNLGAAVATIVFLIILSGVGTYMLVMQTRLRKYSV